MEDYEDDEFFDSQEQTVSIDEDDEEEDPKGNAFMRGVEKATEIRDVVEGEEEEEY
ncbi:hypothetical protein KY349_03075 [Candidatus Woesearchaeota archaeon]|nr:hypothetical protein [Candidatus Woesearchaeota archaeon]